MSLLAQVGAHTALVPEFPAPDDHLWRLTAVPLMQLTAWWEDAVLSVYAGSPDPFSDRDALELLTAYETAKQSAEVLRQLLSAV